MFYAVPTGASNPRKTVDDTPDAVRVPEVPDRASLQVDSLSRRATTLKNKSSNTLFERGIPSTSTPLAKSVAQLNGSEDSRLLRSAVEFVKEEQPVVKSPDAYVGFATLPDQLHRRAVKKGFSFNLMVVGESGLGKSTFINSLFLKDICKRQKENQPPADSSNPARIVSVRTNKIRLTESSVSFDLTLIDTPGFGDSLDNSGCWEPIVSFIDEKYEEYLNAETSVNRVLPIADNRVHCCLYFISPNGHGLRSIDVEFMRRLDSKVNIVPLIAKADTLTSDELKSFKQRIREDLSKEQIKIFDFKDCFLQGKSESAGPMAARAASELSLSPPFAVVGSNCIIEKDGMFIRGREYPWGFVNVESTEHCEFIPLRKLLIRTHMCDIKDKTHRVHYEAYRTKRLSAIYADTSIPLTESNWLHSRTLLSQIEEDNRRYEEHLRQMEAEMQDVFDAKVAEKLQKLEESRENVRRTYDNYKRAIDEEAKRIESRRMEFEKEKAAELDYVSIKSESSNSTHSLRSRPLFGFGKQRKSLF